jgi:hypothetical protein
MTAVQAPGLVDSLKRVAAALRRAGVPFTWAGGLAVRARGGTCSPGGFHRRLAAGALEAAQRAAV